MKVVVEGIETPEQLDVVAAETAVDEVQGFLFSVPLPARAIRELLASSLPPAKLPAIPARLQRGH
jgi:EAL domain-containing protein (putative c-di-GMP-specific phosphodiesterase class I)